MSDNCPKEVLALVNSLYRTIESSQEYGTPGRVIGRRCVVCRGEGNELGPITHDSSCELLPVLALYSIEEAIS